MNKPKFKIGDVVRDLDYLGFKRILNMYNGYGASEWEYQTTFQMWRPESRLELVIEDNE